MGGAQRTFNDFFWKVEKDNKILITFSSITRVYTDKPENLDCGCTYMAKVPEELRKIFKDENTDYKVLVVSDGGLNDKDLTRKAIRDCFPRKLENVSFTSVRYGKGGATAELCAYLSIGSVLGNLVTIGQTGSEIQKVVLDWFSNDVSSLSSIFVEGSPLSIDGGITWYSSTRFLCPRKNHSILL